MATKALVQHEEPFHSRRTDLFGQVDLHAPKASPQFWDILPWELRTELDGTGNPPGLRFLIKPESVMEAFRRPHLITKEMQHLQGIPTPGK
jgi:hypothetical protein